MRRIERIGEREIRATTAMAARAGRGGGGRGRVRGDFAGVLDDRAPLARHLREMRDLARLFAELQAASGAERKRLASELARREEQIRSLAAAIDHDRASLMADNAVLAQQEHALQHEIRTLREYARLTGSLAALIDSHAVSVALSDEAAARAIQTDVLLGVRQRQRDVLMQLTVASQTRTALRQVRRGNIEVIRALRSASATMLTALRAAALAVRSVQDQRPMDESLDEVEPPPDAWSKLVDALDDIDGRRRNSLAQAGRMDERR